MSEVLPKDQQLSHSQPKGPLKDSGKRKDAAKPLQKYTLWTQVVAAIAGALCQLSVGGIVSYSGVTLLLLTDPKSQDIILNQAQISLFGSIINVGNLFGSLLAGVITTWIGQRKTMLHFLPVAVLGWTLLGLSPSFGLMLFSRLLLGAIVGILNVVTYNYVVEIAHTAVRGRLIALLDLFRQIGYTLTAAISTLHLTWRQQAFVQIGVLVLPFVILLFMADSPRWLSTKKRHGDALKSLTFFRGSHYDVSNELEQIFGQVPCEEKRMGVWNQLKLIRSKNVLPIFLVTSFVMFFLHFDGNAPVVSYSVVIFDSAHVPIDSYMSATVSSSLRIVGALLYIVLSGRCRNKNLLCIPSLLVGASMIVLGLFFYLRLGYDLSSFSWLPLASMSLYGLFLSIYYPAWMLIRGEVLPNSVRSLASGFHFSLMSLGMFVVTFGFPYMTEAWGSHWTFWFFGFFALIKAVVVWVFIPETKGKTLEEIGELRMKTISKRKEHA